MNQTIPLGKVLIVEDETALRQLYARILQTAGFETATAASGQEAIAVIKASARDELSVILSDISMPGMNGLDLLYRVREHGCEAPVLLVTGNPTIESAAKAVEYGAMRYLLKPVARQELISLVGHAAKLHRIAVLKREAALHLGTVAIQAADRAGLEASLAGALATLWMAYQPIVDASTGKIIAYEALVRTREASVPHPGILFSIAERLGRVLEVGCAIRAQVAALLGEGRTDRDIFLNLHPGDLLEESLYDDSAPLTFFAGQIVLEITERAALEQVPDIAEKIRRLRRLGYRIAIDDLGAGYSGLNYFAMLSPDIVKLDMALIRNLHLDEVKQKIIGSLCSLCRELDIRVVGEGVECVEEATMAASLGCDLLQGFLFARPGPPFPALAGENERTP